MPIPDPLSVDPGTMSSDERTAQVGLVRERMLASMRQLGIDPASRQGQEHMQDAMMQLGFDPLTGRAMRPVGAMQDLPPPPEHVARGGGRESLQLGQMGGDPFASTVTPRRDPSLARAQTRLAARAEEERAAQAYIDRPSIVQPSRKQTRWMQNPEELERATFNMTGKLRMEQGKGKGKWVPFSAMPTRFQENFAQEYGKGEPPPAGWWTKDLNRRERMLVNRLALMGAEEKRKMPETFAASGPPRPVNL